MEVELIINSPLEIPQICSPVRRAMIAARSVDCIHA